MRNFPRFLPYWLVVTLLAISTTAFANDYYVSPSGIDSNDGSQAHPWATLQHANSALVLGSSSGGTVVCGTTNVGTCVHVLPGTYNGGQIITTKSGTSTQRIVFYSETKWAAIIRLTLSAVNIWGVNGSWVDVNGFDVSESGIPATYGLVAQGSHVRFIGNRIHDLAGSGLAGTTCNGYGGAGITLPNNFPGTTDNQAIGNWIHDIGVAGFCNKIHGIYAQVPNSVVENNVVYRVAAWGINCSHSCTGAVSNNTVFSNGGYGTSNNGTFAMGGCILLGSDSTSSGFTVNNNICKDNGASGSGAAILNITGTLNNVQIANNLFQNTNSGNGAGGEQGCTTLATCINLGAGSGQSTIGNLVNVSPRFVNYQANGSGDYHLASGSPAIAAGTLNCIPGGLRPCVPSTDFDAALRFTPPFIGAYDATQQSGTVNPPTGLVATVQ